MKQHASGEEPRPGVSRLKLALGAASLFLFIVGVKRTFRTDDGGRVVRVDDEPEQPDGEARAATPPAHR